MDAALRRSRSGSDPWILDDDDDAVVRAAGGDGMGGVMLQRTLDSDGISVGLDEDPDVEFVGDGDAARGGPGGGGGAEGAENPGGAWVVQAFRAYIREGADTPAAVAAVRALTDVIQGSSEGTLMGLLKDVTISAQHLRDHIGDTALSVGSGCELFMRFVTRTVAAGGSDFVKVRAKIVQRGQEFVANAARARDAIGGLMTSGESFLRDGVTVMTHGYSRVAVSVLLRAAHEGMRISVVVTESRPGNGGYLTAKVLSDASIPCTVIADSAAGLWMEQVNSVLVGCEGVMENGGVINRIGTYNLALIAKASGKPFYAAAESFKFMRHYPLNQRDVPQRRHAPEPKTQPENMCEGCAAEHGAGSLPDVVVDRSVHDYTPPKYITLLFSEIGVLTPSAVSDELIKLYT
jgi:translation initiation factor eIF-2B subunit alpha